MNSVITNALFDLYSTGFIENIYETLMMILQATKTAIENYHVVSIAFDSFAGIMASLIIIFFYLDLMEQVSRELFSFEKLIVAFIRLIACVAVCACFPNICTLIIDFGIGILGASKNAMNQMIASGTQLVILEPDNKADFESQMSIIYPGGAQGSGVIKQIRYALEHPVWSIEAFVIMLAAAITKLVAYFIGISTAIIFIARLFFAPIGIVNIYRGEQSSGMRYFKGLIASASTFAAMLAIVFAAFLLSQVLISNGAFVKLGILDEEDSDLLEYGGIEVVKDSSTHGAWYAVNEYESSPIDLEKTKYLSGTLDDYIVQEGNTYMYYPPYIMAIDISESTLDHALPEQLAQYLEEHNIFETSEDVEEAASGVFVLGTTGLGVRVMFNEVKTLVYNMLGKRDDADAAQEQIKKLVNSVLDPMLYQSVYDPYFSLALNFRIVLTALIPQLAAIAGMAGASRIINDAFGVGGAQ